MNTHTALPLVLALSAGLLLATAARSDDPVPPPPPTPNMEEMKRMMACMEKLATPGEQHKAMEYYVGTWDVEVSMPGMPAAPSMGGKATAEFSWLVPGLWMGQRMEGTLFGKPYKGFAMLGFDNYRKNHVACWVDSSTTAMGQSHGVVVDPSGKIQVGYGTIDEWMTGELGKPVKFVTRRVDADHHVLEIHDLGIGENGAVVMTYSYTRKK